LRENLDVQHRLARVKRAAVAEAVDLMRLGELAERRA